MLFVSLEEMRQFASMAKEADKSLTKNRCCDVCANAKNTFNPNTCYTSCITYCNIYKEDRTRRIGFMCEYWKALYPEYEGDNI